jgi:hypothetical protein
VENTEPPNPDQDIPSGDEAKILEPAPVAKKIVPFQAIPLQLLNMLVEDGTAV